MQIDGGVTVSFGCPYRTAVVSCHDQVQSQLYWPYDETAQALLRLTMFADDTILASLSFEHAVCYLTVEYQDQTCRIQSNRMLSEALRKST